MAHRFLDHRRSQSVEYTVEDLVTLCICALVSEYEGLDDHVRLHAGSVLALGSQQGGFDRRRSYSWTRL